MFTLQKFLFEKIIDDNSAALFASPKTETSKFRSFVLGANLDDSVNLIFLSLFPKEKKIKRTFLALLFWQILKLYLFHQKEH